MYLFSRGRQHCVNNKNIVFNEKITLFMSVLHFTGSSSEIVHVKAMEDDPKRRKPDISLAKRVLGWSPKVKMTDGLEQTIKYFKSELKKNDNVWGVNRKGL